jgi:Fibronectin type III domain
MSAPRLIRAAIATLAVLAWSAPAALAAEPPTVIGESAPGPKAEEARLEAVVNPNNQSTECHFQYGEAAVSENEQPCEQATIEGGEQDVGLTVFGLKQNTTYNYRVLLKNTLGEEAIGNTESFTTALHPQAPVTLSPAQSITATSAVLEGTLNPGASATDGWFFDYSNPGGSSCTEGPATALEPEVTGEALPEHAEATGLQPSMKYLFCMVARNEPGETERSASEASFTTSPAAPTIDEQSESSVTPFDATLAGLVNPNNEETTYHLEYATDSMFTENVKTLAYGISPPGVYGDESVGPVDLAGALTPSTTYYYRVVAKNATGEVKGTAEHSFSEFTTLPAEKPSVEGEMLIGATRSSDTIEAQLNPKYQGVGCEVQYVTEEIFESTGFTENVAAAGCSPVPPAEGFGQGSSPVAFTATLSGLQENTAYEYRVVASNATGTFEGVPQLLARTPPQLTGATLVEAITQHTALMQPSSITPEVPAPLEASYYVLYGAGAADEIASGHVSAGSGLAPNANAVAPIALSGLQPGTTYHYEVVAYNGNASTTGPELTFTTALASPVTTPPAVGGESARFVNGTSAVIEAEVNPQGGETTYEVQYGTSNSYGQSVPGPVAIAPDTSAQGTIVSLVGLAPGTTYHYRLAATNQAGTNYGPDATFTTAGAARTGAFTPFSVPSTPQIAITPFVFPKEEPGTTGTTAKTLTNKQKLAAALKACSKRHRARRAACKRQAHKRYGAKAALRHRTGHAARTSHLRGRQSA